MPARNLALASAQERRSSIIVDDRSVRRGAFGYGRAGATRLRFSTGTTIVVDGGRAL